jgi:hypothetical protein
MQAVTQTHPRLTMVDEKALVGKVSVKRKVRYGATIK